MQTMPTLRRVLSVSLSKELARKVERLAKEEDRTISEMFREAFRRYSSQHTRRTKEAAKRLLDKESPRGDEDISRSALTISNGDPKCMVRALIDKGNRDGPDSR